MYKKNGKNEEMVIPISESEDKEETDKEAVESVDKLDVEEKESEYVERLQRLQAEFHNYKKRIDKERGVLYTIAKGDLVFKLLSVLDDFERVLQHHQIDDQSCLDGVQLIYKNLNKILVDEGLEEIPSVGKSFNPELHEAVSVEESDPTQDGLVTEEWQKGYLFGDRLLRPSRVKVGQYTEKPSNG